MANCPRVHLHSWRFNLVDKRFMGCVTAGALRGHLGAADNFTADTTHPAHGNLPD